MVVRGVPKRLANDAWWLDDERPMPRWMLALALLVCVGIADQMIWAVRGGVGFVLGICVIATAIHLTLWATVDRTRTVRAWSILLLAVIPAVELVQAASVLIAVLGLLGFAAVMVLGRWDAPVILRAMMRLPGVGLLQTVTDFVALRLSVPQAGSFRAVVFDWALPLGVGAIFVVLMATANPVVDQWLIQLTRFESGVSLDATRIAFWVFAALLIWPFLHLTKMAGALGRETTPRLTKVRFGLLNDRSVMRALVMFNLIFAVQSLLDLGYLWGGVALPETMTYAQYAHRGAYPLLVTALLAGVFALLAQPFLDGQPLLRGLLYLWIGQTVLLVLSSILRLDLYVDAYGLTRLRFAAIVWMVVVALGLVLMIMQMVGRQTVGWFTLRAAGLGLVAVYACALINVDGLIARTNLTREKLDVWYLCQLSEGAAPAIMQSGLQCPSHQPRVSTPVDWREWGYRNARLRRSLAQMEIEQ